MRTAAAKLEHGHRTRNAADPNASTDEHLARPLLPLRPHRHPGRRERRPPTPARPASSNWAGCSREELRALGLRDAAQDEHGIVLATIPATVPHAAPTIAWIAHVDTSPETSGRNVKPIVHRNYDGGDIVLPGDPTQGASASPTIRSWPRSRARRSSPPTARRCSAPTTRPASPSSWRRPRICWPSPEIPHGPIRVCFTCDEEIGHGVDHVDLKKLGARRRLHARRRRRRRDRRRDLLRRPGRRHDHAASTSIRRSPRAAWSTRCAWPALFLDRLPRPVPVAGDDRRPRGLPASLPHRGRRRRGDAAHPAARLRHAEAGRAGRAAAQRSRRTVDGGVSARRRSTCR